MPGRLRTTPNTAAAAKRTTASRVERSWPVRPARRTSNQRSRSTTTTASTATVSLGTLTFASGRATKAVAANAFAAVAPNYRAYKDVRVRFSCSLASCGQVINTCSTDGFTVRPQGLTVGVTKSDGTTALNSTSPSTGTPSLMAGADEATLAESARPAGWRPLLEAGVDVAARRLTTTAEVLRVLLAGSQ